MNTQPTRLRIADYLSRAACWLRGNKWYVADAWCGVPGNRAAELQQQITEELVLVGMHQKHKESFDRIERKSSELAQLAGENWGHVWPKEKQ